MGRVTELACSGCARRFAPAAVAACPECWSALEPEYDLDAARRSLTRDAVASRPLDVWRYHELLPVDRDERIGRGTGFTPLLEAPRLGARLGIRALFVKYEAACHPTQSFKDRLVAVALAKALELGMETVGCASTGNLATALAAGAAAAGLESVILLPEDVEAARLAATDRYGAMVVGVRGGYDRANRLSIEIADRTGWGFVNVNLRAYYGEGAKTVAFEIAEQGGWRLPGHVVVPIAGGGLLTRMEKAFRELVALGLVEDRPFSVHGAQPKGCAPVVQAWRTGLAEPRPVKPETIVRSLAFGDPPDGAAALAAIRRTGGAAEDPGDAEALEAVRLLAETEGLVAEAAGGIVIAAARRLAAAGAFSRGGPVVLVITGRGLPATEAPTGRPAFPVINGLSEFERLAGHGRRDSPHP